MQTAYVREPQMPFKTEWVKHPGWMEPVQVWVDPTPEELEAEAAYAKRGEELYAEMDELIDAMRKAMG